MRKNTWLLMGLFALFSCQACDKEDDGVGNAPPPSSTENGSAAVPEVTTYLTKGSSTSKFVKSTDYVNASSSAAEVSIDVTVETEFQTMKGFGFALTGGSAMHINSMDATAQDALLQNLFGTEASDIGMSYIRVSIGASDLDENTFTYNDLSTGQTDVAMDQFSLAPDEDHLIPVLKKIVAINPEIQILGSPWSAPTWMKDNGAFVGGNLKSEYYDAYALYFVKYIQQMAAQGIDITSVTVQNEPLHAGNNPSMHMTAEEQIAFIGGSLGPAFAANEIDVKIIAYDHNPDVMQYSIDVLSDSVSGPYVDGAAFHLYGGGVGSFSALHSSFPDKNIYFTEQWYDGYDDFGSALKWHTAQVMVGSTRNWSTTVIEWNLAASPDFKPHTPGGCDRCMGALTIDGNEVTYNAGYYVIAHASKKVRPGSVRINSNNTNDVSNVCFLTPDHQIVMVAVNNSESSQTVNVQQGDVSFSFALDAGAVITHIWDK